MVNWTAKDLVGLKVPTEVAVSSDGTKIAIVVSEPDWDSGVMVSNLWLWRNGDLSQWTFGDKSIARPKFSTDGNWLAFLAKSAKNDEAKNQIWLISLNGGEPRQLTEAKEGVVTFEWHPDSKFIWCVIPEAKPEEREQAKEVDRKRRADFSYHDDALPKRALWKFEVPDGKGEKVFVGDAGIYELKVSPDGRRIVFATTFTGKRDDWRRSKLFWLFVDEPKIQPQPLCERAGAQTSPQFSPDGAKVAFLSWREPERSFSHHRIFAADFEGNCHELNSTPDLEIEMLHWKHRWLFCLLQTGCTSQIWQVDENEAVPITDNDWVIAAFDVSANGKTFAAIRTNDRNPPEVWLGELEGKQVQWTQIGDFNPQVKQWKLSRAQIVRWHSDGMEVEGMLWLPPEEPPYPTPLPTVVWVHGGPKSRAAKALLSAAGIPTFLASRGYAVLAPNFRGSSGYSNEFATANFRDLGGSDFLDILSGVEWCIAQGIADPERIGIVGGSYGGYMTNWALAHSERFKAGVSLYGIALLFSDFGNSNNPSWEPDYLGGFPWEVPELYLQRSPFIHAHKIKAPLLLLHGDSDLNTFISNSQEMFTALKKLGRKVEFVRYPREGHGFQEPNHRVDVLERILIWFDRWLKDDPFASAVHIGEQASNGNLSAHILDRAKILHPVNLELSESEKLVSVVLSIEAKDNDRLLLSRDVRLLDSNGREHPVTGLLQTDGETCWIVEGDLQVELAQRAISLNLAFRLPAESQPAAVKVRHLILRV